MIGGLALASTNPKLKIRASASEIDLSIFHSKAASMKKCAGCLNYKSQLQHSRSKATVASSGRPYFLPRVSHLESLDRHGSSTLEPKCIPTSTRVKSFHVVMALQGAKKCSKARAVTAQTFQARNNRSDLGPYLSPFSGASTSELEGMSQC